MSDFPQLRDRYQKYQKLWRDNERLIGDVLTTLNSEVFDGKWQIKSNHLPELYKSVEVCFPNIALFDSKLPISDTIWICPDPDDRYIRIVAVKHYGWPYSGTIMSFLPSKQNLTKYLIQVIHYFYPS